MEAVVFHLLACIYYICLYYSHTQIARVLLRTNAFQKVSEYDQEMTQWQTTDQNTAPLGRDKEQ